ncbi:hypothetical protein CDD81_7596 [Ophiocordyceps australis]|uniref:Carbohydrate-binding domain-containing protein n=1 Tax=Ophiocordyceps australis TaxID=1399860 RepID=A0A2C5Y3P6_9HYPO|nr:hypothetical protein CDD81_7596 [Ophiocordyceps australis]
MAALVLAAALLPARCIATPSAHIPPRVWVPACPLYETITFSSSVPPKTYAVPSTEVRLCYGQEHLHANMTAHGEEHFYYNETHKTNDDLWEYEVLEIFMSRGWTDPTAYLEFQVSPANVTYRAMVVNPSKRRQPGAAFDHWFADSPMQDGFFATTQLDRKAKTWQSNVRIPLVLFNIDGRAAKETAWRMNFFRTIVGPDTFPQQQLAAWSPPNETNFHITEYFGRVIFT